MRQITKRQFDAFCYVRQSVTLELSQEFMWFEAGGRKLLASVFMDRVDRDYGYVILGRDSRKLFRAIEVSKEFRLTPQQVVVDLQERLEFYSRDTNHFYSQGDEIKQTNEIFNSIKPNSQLHPYYKILTNEPRQEAARNLIKEIAYSFTDVDGNYIEQFQTTGFDARLWELFLYVFFYNSGFNIDRKHNVPDFCLSKSGHQCFVEAVTVGGNFDFDVPNAKTAQEVVDYSKDYMPIKFGSALFSKINRKKPYWDFEHVKGNPFILAIHDYHIAAGGKLPGSMTWSRAALSNYLYGQRDLVEFDENGKPQSVMVESAKGLVPKIEKISSHTWKHKTIPSNFFELPNTEHVSAVLFSNAATITTFNRMGKLAGMGGEDITMVRLGVRMSESGRPVPFSINIDADEYEESWGDNVVMYHNPNAVNVLDPNLFSEITHVFYNKILDEFFIIQNPNEWYSSITQVIILRKEDEIVEE